MFSFVLANYTSPCKYHTDRRQQTPGRTARLRLEWLEKRELLSGATQYHFDFGTATSPVATGCTVVGPTAAYNGTQGYGWQSTSGLMAVDHGGNDLLTRDDIQGRDNTFLANLPNGTYLVTPILGDATSRRSRMSIWLQDNLVGSNLATVAGQFLRPTYQVQVTNGQFKLRIADLNSVQRFAIDGLDIVPSASLVASAGPNISGNEGSTVSFAGSASGGSSTLSYLWNFGDGTTAEGTLTPSHVYADNGSYTVTLTVSDGAGHTSRASTVATIANVAPAPNTGGPYSGTVGGAILFSGSATDPSSKDSQAGFTYLWNFGDGTTSTQQNPSHVYAAAGTYTVRLTVTDKDGGSNTSSTTATVSGSTSTLVANAGPNVSGNEGSSVSFAGSATGGSGTLTYQWAFGDGSTATGTLTPSHVYADNGSYTVTLTVTDGAGHSSQASTVATIANVAPTPNIGGPYTGTAGSAIAFNGSATDPSSTDTTAGFTYAWNFGDGTTSTQQSPSHVYATAGTYTVSLTATDKNGGANTTSTTVTVGSSATLVANAGPNVSGNEGASVSFAGSTTGGSGALTYQWAFGDGSTASGTLTPSHVYADNGSYTVTLTVTDGAGHTSQASTVATIANVAPTPNIGGPYNGTVGMPFTFTGSATDPSSTDTAAGFTYAWNFGDGATSNLRLPSHTYTATGTYTVTFTVTDKDSDSSTITTQVNVMSSTALTVTLASPPKGNPGGAVTFVANVSSAASGPVTYSWNFGDGATQSSTTPLISHSYTAAGNYTAKVTVTDSSSAQSSSTVAVQVSSTALPNVTLDGTSFALAGSPVAFSVSNPNQPPTGGFTYSWNFGDGATSTSSTPTTSHSYSTAGNYVAAVTVTDSAGHQAYSSAAVSIHSSTDSANPLFKPVVDSTSFTYLGSFGLPQSANGWDTAASFGGLAYRYVGGNLQFFTTNHVNSGGLVYEFNYPGISTNPSNLPQAQVVNNWGDIYSNQRIDYIPGGSGITYGLYYEQGSNRLYWTYGDIYNAAYPYQPSIGYSTLNDTTHVATGAGAWSLTNRPEKYNRGGMVQIPQWFANSYTGGDTLGVGFGGYFSVISSASVGPALAAIAPPNPSANPIGSSLSNIPLLGYPFGAPDRAHRDTGYTNYYDGGTYPTTPGQWNPANGTGYWTWSDSIFDGGAWIDTPSMQGVLVIAKVGQGAVYYQSSDRHALRGAFEWLVYDPADLAAVASGAKQQWQIQPKYEWTTPSLLGGDQNGFSGDGSINVGGVVFDPTTNRLYVLVENVYAFNGFEAWPEMYVYQVGPPHASSTPGSPFVVSDTQAGFSITGIGWNSTSTGYFGELLQINNSAPGAATATWQTSSLAAGSYTLAVDWHTASSTNTSSAVYKIYDGATLVTTVTINQQQLPSGVVNGGSIFQSLGTVHISSGNLRVVAANQASGDLGVDALLVTPF